MSETTASLRRKIDSAGDLQSVVRTMKAVVASSIGQYEKSVRALADYYRAVELGFCACLRENRTAPFLQNGKVKQERVRLVPSCLVRPHLRFRSTDRGGEIMTRNWKWDLPHE